MGLKRSYDTMEANIKQGMSMRESPVSAPLEGKMTGKINKYIVAVIDSRDCIWSWKDIPPRLDWLMIVKEVILVIYPIDIEKEEALGFG